MTLPPKRIVPVPPLAIAAGTIPTSVVVLLYVFVESAGYQLPAVLAPDPSDR